MSHPRAMMEDEFLRVIDEFLEGPTTANERWFAELVVELVRSEAGEHPAVVRIVNDRVLRAIQKREAQQQWT